MNGNLDSGESTRSRKHLLLTVLGISPQPAMYTLGGRNYEANLSPLALLKLLKPEDRPNQVLAICTPEAKDRSWPTLQSGLSELNADLTAELVGVPNTGNPGDVGDYLTAIAAKIPNNVDLTVDITHGFRHYSFLTYAAVLYLSALRGIRVRGIYYGMLQDLSATSPFINLRRLLESQNLIYAVRTLRDTGSAMPLADALEAYVVDDPTYGLAAGSPGSKELVSDLFALSEAHASGLPLEFGERVHSVLQLARERQRERQRRLKIQKAQEAQAEKLEQQGAGSDVVATSLADFAVYINLQSEEATDDGPTIGDLLFGPELFVQFRSTLEPLELRAGANWKNNVELDEDELKRQARIIDYQLGCHNTSTAIGMMVEWTVSWTAWCKKDAKDWLQYNESRRRATEALNQIKPGCCHSEAGQCVCSAPRKCRLSKFWCDLTKLRNSTHHHGMTKNDLLAGDDRGAKIRSVREYWDGTLKVCPDYSDLLEPVPATDKRVLVSPVGMTPGVLLTALEACRSDDDIGEPSLCIIVCSNESKAMVDEALRTHGKYEGEIHTLIFQDPQGGVSELDRVTGSAHHLLEDAQEAVVNVTGGTTLMGVAVEKIASNAQKIARNSPGSRSRVRRIGLIDRRPREQQESDPYVVGDVIWIDDQAG